MFYQGFKNLVFENCHNCNCHNCHCVFWTQLYDFEDTKLCLVQRKTTSYIY